MPSHAQHDGSPVHVAPGPGVKRTTSGHRSRRLSFDHVAAPPPLWPYHAGLSIPGITLEYPCAAGYKCIHNVRLNGDSLHFRYIYYIACFLIRPTFFRRLLCASANRLSHERVGAALGGIAQLEKQVLDAKAKLKGKERKEGTRPTKRIEELEMQREKTLEILEMGSKR